MMDEREEIVRRLIIITDADEIRSMKREIHDLKVMRNTFMVFLVAMAILTVIKLIW